jgi:hypothetical protein
VLEGPEAEELKESLLGLFEDLEELVVLAWLREQPTTLGVGITELAEAVHLPLTNVREAVERLVKRELVAKSALAPVSYCYAAKEHELEARIERIVSEFRANPVQVMGFMTANAIERLRTAALHTFADSFRVKKPRSDG